MSNRIKTAELVMYQQLLRVINNLVKLMEQIRLGGNEPFNAIQ